MKRFLLILVLATALTGCHTPSGQAWVRSEIYFGQTKPSGAHITPTDWQTFLDEVVTPQFPAGLTVFDATGQWRNATGHIDREPSKVLVLVHPPSREIEQKLDAIRVAYCQRFEQEAVLKVTTKARVTF
ncbi:MAG: DUF3574 domain-containing protein [Verrucomicrobiota bacterium]